MAFSFQTSGGSPYGIKNNPMNNGSNVQAQNGSDLEDIQTENIGFQAISGDAKVQLLSSPWPSDNLPQPTSSLLSIASRRGLLAAAGPDSVVVAYTENVRKAFGAPGGERNIKPFEPQLLLPMPFRISQLTFSADEEYLILSAETGGGLAVYEVQALLNGSKEITFQIATNQEAVRALVPNPATERGELIAVVTTEGKLMVANLKQKGFILGANGQVLKEKVSCVSWSKLGKQLVAGLADGTAYQLTPEGVGKAEIPSPPSLSGNHHVSQILWLETTVFLTVHTPTSYDNSQAPSSEFHIVTKQAPASQNTPPAFGQAPQPQATTYVFQKVSEPAGPFGLNRSPPHHFILRLKDFPPNLQDALIVTSSASSDVGLLTRSATPLESSKQITNVFTNTEPADDARRAALPIGSDDATDTSPIGAALDLSSKDFVYRPIPLDDEIDKSDGPLPGLVILNNEGVLSSWWLVYSDSIRQKTTYPGLASQQSTQQPAQQQPAFASKPAQSTFGAPSAFGASSAFGAGSGLGPKTSPWGTTTPSSTTSTMSTPAAPTFGASTFGTPSLPSALAAPAKPFQSAPQSATPAFGHTASFGSSALPGQKVSPWGAPSTAVPTIAPATGSSAAGGGFAAFANKGGFASVPSSGNVLSSQPTSGGFSGFSGGSNAFGQPEQKSTSIFGKPAETTVDSSSSSGTTTNAEQNGSSLSGQTKLGGLFGTGPVSTLGNTAEKSNPFSQDKPGGLFGAGTFKLGSTFKPDGSAADDLPKPANTDTGSLFGSGFGDALSGSQTPAPKNESTGGSNDISTTPSATPAAPKFRLGNAAPKTSENSNSGSIFGIGASAAAPNPPTAGAMLWGAPKPAAPSSTPGGILEDMKTNSSGPATTSSSIFSPGSKQTAPSITPGSIFGSTSNSGSIFGGSGPKELPKKNNNLFGNFGTPAETDSPAALLITPTIEIKKDASKETDAPEPEAPLPPDFSTLPKAPAGDGPLPPDFFPKIPAKDQKQDDLPAVPLAEDSDNSNGNESGGETYSLHTEDDEGEGEGEEEEGFSEEGSDEDVAKDLSPLSDSNQNLGYTPQSSFGDRAVKKGPSTLFASVNKPANNSSSRKPLFGEIPKFSPPIVPGSPRSPSPVRSVIPNRMRPETLRSVSTPPVVGPGIFSASTSHPAPFRPAPVATFSMDQKIAEDAKRAKAKAEKEAREAEEAQAMIDYEDNLAQKQLSAEIVPTTVLDEFIAHQDYIGSADRTGIPAQVETVYRDINSMIDTLGMNARALKAFLIGHTTKQKATGRTKDDLENDDEDWVLVEIENLTSIIEQDLAKDLEENRIKDASRMFQECSDLKHEADKLRQKHEEIKCLVARNADPDLRQLVQQAPLTAEQAKLQSDIREQFKDFQSYVVEAEQKLTLLKAKLVSQGGKANVNGSGVPTLEAVMRTISKMTAMAEKKSGDVDVLENEIRKMTLGASRGPGSREGSPLAASTRSSPLGQSTLRTSTVNRTPLRSSMVNNYSNGRSSGVFQTPDNFRSTPAPNRGFGMSGASKFSQSHGSLGSSMRSSMIGSPSKLTLENVPDEATQRMIARMARKKAVADQLRVAMDRVAPRVLSMDDDYEE